MIGWTGNVDKYKRDMRFKIAYHNIRYFNTKMNYKNIIVKLFTIVKNDSQLSLHEVKKQWQETFDLLRDSGQIVEFLTCEYRVWIVYMSMFLANQSFDLDSRSVEYSTGKTKELNIKITFNLYWLKERLELDGIKVQD